MPAILDYPKITLIRPQGVLNAANATEFQKELETAVWEINSNLLIDLEQVESLDSAGLMALVSALKLAQSLGRRFSLCSVSASIKIIFELTQLDRVFEIFDSKAAAVAATAA
jgi:anti-sigma B factor antagonist